MKTFTAGDAIDCTGRDVTVGSTGNVKVIDGSLTLIAANLTINNGGAIQAIEQNSGNAVGLHITLTGNATISGTLRADTIGGGSEVTLDLAGDLLVLESGTDGIEANGVGTDVDGGTVQIRARHVTLYDPIRADGGANGTTWGGNVEIVATGNISTGADGKIQVGGRQGGAGTIRLTAEGSAPNTQGDVTLAAKLEAEGRLNDGNGGEISVIAKNKIDISAPLSARGGVTANGGNAIGGAIVLDAGCDGVVINGDLDARGGEASGVDGGAVVVTSAGDIVLKSARKIISEATANGGLAGDISLVSKSKIMLEGTSTIDGTGDSTEGHGATVELRACTVEVGSGAIIDTTAFEAGFITLGAGAKPGTPRLATGALQPLVIRSGSSLKVAGDTNGDDGTITLIVSDQITGCCTNSATGTCAACTVDNPNCVFGCDTGDCDDANPDTDGVTTQFDRPAETIESHEAGDCAVSCE